MSAFDAEIDDAKRVAIRRGFGHLEFNWQERDNLGTAAHATEATVTVESVDPAVRRVYGAGHGKAWLQEFESDLAAGTFGSASR